MTQGYNYPAVTGCCLTMQNNQQTKRVMSSLCNYSPQSAYREHRDMLGKKQITAKNAKQTKESRGFFLAVTMQFMGAISDEGKQLPDYLNRVHLMN